VGQWGGWGIAGDGRVLGGAPDEPVRRAAQWVGCGISVLTNGCATTSKYECLTPTKMPPFATGPSAAVAEGPVANGGIFVGVRHSYFDVVAQPFVSTDIPQPTHWAARRTGSSGAPPSTRPSPAIPQPPHWPT